MLRRCEILTDRVLEAALRRQLPADERAVLLRHLAEPCEACLNLLEGWTAEEMLQRLYSPDDLLSRGEQERLFATAASAGERSSAPAVRLAPVVRRPIVRLAWAPATIALALVGLLLVVRPGHRGGEEGLKGPLTPSVALIPLAGARTPTPHVVRALPPDGRLAPGELLLLRIRLGAPAWVYLLSQKQGETAELLWPVQEAGRHSAGEFELAESGSALAIDPRALGPGGRVLVIASPEAVAGGRLQLREPVRTRAELQKLFPGCGVDVLPVAFEPD
jgi:hypothetical protein